MEKPHKGQYGTDKQKSGKSGIIDLANQRSEKATLMTFRIRSIAEIDQFCNVVTVDVLTRIIPLSVIEAVLRECGALEQRRRKLPATLTVLLCIAMYLFADISLRHTLLRLVKGVRLLTADEVTITANRSAISEARYRLGAKPLEQLFKQLCHPIATPDTLGAFAFGWRLVALDGSIDHVLDWPENAAYFGGKRSSAFPLVQGAFLCECGTHVIFDAGFWPYRFDERKGCRRLLRSVTDEMLVMFDQGLYSYDMLVAIRERGAQVLGRILPYVTLKPERRLVDGSYLAYIAPSQGKRQARGERLLIRVIEYTLADPQRVGHQQRHRIVTTLLDSVTCPALDLICLYHERWEAEMAFDEIDTIQLASKPLRSHKPEGVIQELYALLLAHFVVRVMMHEVAIKANLDPDRLSFIGTIRLIGDAIPEFQLVDPGDHPRLWQRLLNDIAHCRIPPRENRINPRVVKQPVSKFKGKRPEHFRLPKLTKTFREAVLLL
ncbi:MAG: IS4 family transposase [Anaerolineae bacterium]|nr:IS4 family transposase [Anaerolineae bacterium]